jgi:CxxC motif-containing protein (DUF1111 family)
MSRLKHKIPYTRTGVTLNLCVLFAGVLIFAAGCLAQTAKDPGVRVGPPTAGNHIPGMTTNQLKGFLVEKKGFEEVLLKVVNPVGFGPGFNSNACRSCHAKPAAGGSSPENNPLFSVYQANGATNTMPFFITANGPVVNARAPFLPDGITPDGRVQQMFVITGRSDAPPGCNISQPNFAAEQGKLSFRQVSPTFGAGLIELIQDSDILASFNKTAAARAAKGIGGHPSIAEDGTISRFGWKAQNRSLYVFTGEAMNIEEGVTNELEPNELIEDPKCATNRLPEDHTFFGQNFSLPNFFDGNDLEITNFMRFLATPPRGPATASTTNGQTQFNRIGCNLCHTATFTTPKADVTALSNVKFSPLSDFMVHHMGSCLADNIVQGNVPGDEFRTAPLWGVSQRVFFMHDGRTANIVQAIEDHFCNANHTFQASEANAVINAFNALTPTNQQDLVNFLRIL